ncbi:MAG: isoprenylcysteine carboxylmethyltransferase family protein [Acidimicrobiia bacterium]|nr:isoprenylcysteine carboxylmethyltransferase family protein [Acidimicrobiia bacterium]
MATRTTAWLLVAAQFLLIGAVVLLPGDHWEVTSVHHAIALGLIGVALVIGLWAARWLGAGLTPLPLPNGRVDLVVRGPYRWVRHPMYDAVIIGMGGVAVRSGSWWSAIAWLALVVLLTAKSRWEEGHLVTAFAGYETYRERTGRFVPRKS